MREAIAALVRGSAVAPTLAALEAHLLQAGFDRVDYASLADAASLASLDALGEAPARLLVAARIGGTRLIDNMAVE
jgi:pantoate--beta-alanine ligase